MFKKQLLKQNVPDTVPLERKIITYFMPTGDHDIGSWCPVTNLV